MQITKLTLTNKNINYVIQLIKQTFLEFVAPDYDESGINNFFKFAEDEDLLKQLEFYAALHNDKISWKQIRHTYRYALFVYYS